MEPRRNALIVASHSYGDPKLQTLRSPARDAEELARVLADPTIGDFDVEVSLNERETTVRRKLEGFFKNRARDDLLLLHFSCHGVKDDQGDLYFAAPDTELDHLDSTAISSDFVSRQMSRSLSRRILLLLDCCYSGAFGRGAGVRAGDTVELRERFEGRGRVVLTASNSTEYAFEGDEIVGSASPSIFTAALVRALETGEADRDQDSRISVDELYDYVFDDVHKNNPKQTPRKWSDVEGQLYVARSSFVAVAQLPEELEAAIESPLARVREGTVQELSVVLAGRHRGLAEAARRALTQLTDDDSRRVSSAASDALGAALSQPAVLDAPGITSSLPSSPPDYSDAGAWPITGRPPDGDRLAGEESPPSERPSLLIDSPQVLPVEVATRQRDQAADGRELQHRARVWVAAYSMPALALTGAALVLIANALHLRPRVMLLKGPYHPLRETIWFGLESVVIPTVVVLIVLGIIQGRFRRDLASGMFLGFGLATVFLAVGLHEVEDVYRRGGMGIFAPITTGWYVLAIGAVLILLAGGTGVQAMSKGGDAGSARPSPRVTSRMRVAMCVLTAAGTVLCIAALFIPFAGAVQLYDNFQGHNWLALEAIVCSSAATVASVVGLKVQAGLRASVGFQLALGIQLCFFFLEWMLFFGFWLSSRAGSLKAGGFVGLAGAALIVGSAIWMARSEAKNRPNTEPA